MKKIEDYIHLYIGCDVQWTRSNGAKLISKLTLSDAGWLKRRDDVKLILRPLSSITKEELKEWMHVCSEANRKYPVTIYPNNRGLISAIEVKWLLDHFFDCFELIESCLALDATKIEKV